MTRDQSNVFFFLFFIFLFLVKRPVAGRPRRFPIVSLIEIVRLAGRWAHLQKNKVVVLFFCLVLLVSIHGQRV